MPSFRDAKKRGSLETTEPVLIRTGFKGLPQDGREWAGAEPERKPIGGSSRNIGVERGEDGDGESSHRAPQQRPQSSAPHLPLPHILSRPVSTCPERGSREEPPAPLADEPRTFKVWFLTTLDTAAVADSRHRPFCNPFLVANLINRTPLSHRCNLLTRLGPTLSYEVLIT